MVEECMNECMKKAEGLKSGNGTDFEFKAGRRIIFFCIANLAVWPFFILVMSSLKGWSYMLLLPVALIFIYSYLLTNALRKPIARIYNNKLALYKKKKVLALDKMSSLKLSGKYNAEIILDDQPPMNLSVHEFSRRDREVLISFLQKTIEQNRKSKREEKQHDSTQYPT